VAKSIMVDVNNDSVQATVAKQGATVGIHGEYTVGGEGMVQHKRKSWVPADFTAGERTVLQNAYNIVVAKCRSTEGV
jgi:hypothetical protein